MCDEWLYSEERCDTTKARAFCVENDILALEEDITEDGEANARVALNTTDIGDPYV
jgi:hypothetical protein